jgi:ribosomal-protein-alanine N-acetyltransferase
VRLIVDYAFEVLKLHRIEAGVMPHNIGSIRVLEKAGFHKEGLSKKNVKINGRWEDHLHFAIVNPNDSE